MDTTVRRRLKSLWAIMYYLGFTPIMRNPLFIPFVFSSPFTLLFILFVASNGAALPYGLAGALTMVTTQLGLFVGTDLASYKIQNKFQDVVVASPVTPLTYLFGVAISELIFGSPALVVLFGLMALHGASTVALATALPAAIAPKLPPPPKKSWSRFCGNLPLLAVAVSVAVAPRLAAAASVIVAAPT